MNEKTFVVVTIVIFAMLMIIPLQIQQRKKEVINNNLVLSYKILQNGINKMLEQDKTDLFEKTQMYKILAIKENEPSKAEKKNQAFTKITEEIFGIDKIDVVMHGSGSRTNPGIFLKEDLVAIFVFDDYSNVDNFSIWVDLNGSEPPGMDFVDIWAYRVNKYGKLILCDTNVENLNYVGLNKKIKERMDADEE
ncbi:hypothetical protein IJZ97_06180 [bacterium]|nr:hypothetical protein [bacterium]